MIKIVMLTFQTKIIFACQNYENTSSNQAIVNNSVLNEGLCLSDDKEKSFMHDISGLLMKILYIT